MKTSFEVDFKSISGIIGILLQKLQEYLLESSGSLAEVLSSFFILSLREEILSIDPSSIGNKLILGLTDIISLLILLLLDQQLPSLTTFLRSVKFDDSSVRKDPKSRRRLIIDHIRD